MRLREILCLVALAAAACASSTPAPSGARHVGPRPEITPPSTLCADQALAPDAFCLPAERVVPYLRSGEHEILYHKTTESGVSRPSVVWLGVTEEDGSRIVFRAKWKVAPRGGDGFNNSPYKEIAAYEVQKLFLDPAAYVVPPNIGYCMPRDRHDRAIGSSQPTFGGTDCVFGVMAYWIENVTPDDARDMDRFEHDPAYRLALARLNLFTYLIDHRDPRDANFLVSKDPRDPRVFAIDNGLAFGGFTNPFTFYYGDWGDVRVPMLPRQDVDRLREIEQTDVERLMVVEQFENRDGMLVSVEPTAPIDPGKPVRVRDGVVQLGLTRKEADQIWKRIQQLIQKADAGKIELF